MPGVTAQVTATSGPSQIGGADPAGETITGTFPTFSASSATNGLTAHAGGGQTNALPITTMISRFTTVATAADSSILPAATVGAIAYVRNDGAASMNVFPATGQNFNGGTANAAFAVANGKGAVFFCAVAGIWSTVLSA